MNAEITMYRCQTGERVIVFGGILAGKFAAYENTNDWDDAFELARKLDIEIKPAAHYTGSLAK